MRGDTYLERLEPIAAGVIAAMAREVDLTGAFPRPALDALVAAGLLGLISAPEVGGLGHGHRAATAVVERIARECASTAMVVCMHYAGAAVIEARGPREVREAIAAGKHLTTLAFSEAGSRSHFWAPLSTATRVNGHVLLDAHKSFATSAGEADSYVWSSRPVGADLSHCTGSCRSGAGRRLGRWPLGADRGQIPRRRRHAKRAEAGSSSGIDSSEGCSGGAAHSRRQKPDCSRSAC